MSREPGESKRAEPLLAEFPPPELAEWQQAVTKVLKQATFTEALQTLSTTTYEGINLQPLYTAADGKAPGLVFTQPGASPYLRSTRNLGHRLQPPAIAQELPFPDCRMFNDTLRYDLQRGQDAINLVLDQATRSGMDPDQAPAELVGLGGTSLTILDDFLTALNGVDLAEHPYLVQPGCAALPLAVFLTAHCQQTATDVASLHGSVGADPVADLARAGELPWSLKAAYDGLTVLTQWGIETAPHLKTLAASGLPYHEGGGDAVVELALTMAAAVNHLRELEARGLTVDSVASRILCEFAVGNDFFLEMAKLRAARGLWARLVESCGGDQQAQKIAMHVRSSECSLTCFDAHVNILRGTTQALAAMLAGCDSLHVAPFTSALGLPDEFSRRLARNTQLILRTESHCDQVIDPAGGAWYVDVLTAELAQAAWEKFQQVEAAGGIAAALASGLPQQWVATSRNERRDNLAIRRDVLVGINKYPDDSLPWPSPPESLPENFAEERARAFTTERSNLSQDLTGLLADLERISTSDTQQIFATAVAAAEAGASVNQLARCLHGPASELPRVTPIPAFRGAEPFEAFRRRVLTWRRGRDSDPQVWLANLGPVAEYMPRLDSARTLCQVAGLAVASRDWYADVDAALQVAREIVPPVVIIVSSDARYPDTVPNLVAGLKELAESPLVLLTATPSAHSSEINNAGVDGFIHEHCDALAVLGAICQRLGVPA